MKKLLSLVCVLAFVGCERTPEKRTIEGQVFVRLKGGESIKLSLVNVLLFDEKVIAVHLENKGKATDSLVADLRPREKETKDALDRANAHASSVEADKVKRDAEEAFRKVIAAETYLYSAEYYFEGLPNPLQTTKTDVDGKFAFQIPGGSYVLAAFSNRQAGKSTEIYYWMVKVTLNANKKVMLANDNLSTSGSVDSLIGTLEN